MNLMLKPNAELADLLIERERIFASYRIKSKNKKKTESDQIVINKTFTSTSSNEVLVDNGNRIEANSKGKVISLEKEDIVNTGVVNMDNIKTYNQRMRGGFFGRRRAR